MPKFGATSRANLAECDNRLQKIYNFVIQFIDCVITDGLRTVAEQEKNVAKGVSQTMASKHLPGADGKSRAVDAMPYPTDWNAIQRGLNAVKHADPGMAVLEAYYFQGFVAGVAASQGTKIRQGTDWNGDRNFADHTFIDIPHTELVD